MSNSTLTPIENLISVISSYCESRKIKYVIVGGIAVLFWGRTRTTHDVDIILEHDKLDLDDFVEYLNKNNVLCSKEDIKAAFDSKEHSNTIFYEKTTFRLDIKGIYGKPELESINERYKQKWKGMTLYIDDVHNLIINKLRFGSQQDQEDALAVLIRNIEKINKEKLVMKAKAMNVVSDLVLLFDKAQIKINNK